MLRKKLLFIIFLASFVSVSSFSPKTSLAFLCAFEDTANISICSLLRPPTDTIHILAIYCTGHDSARVLPSYWASIWSDTGNSVPGFFRDNSYSKYLLHCDPIVDFVNGDACPFQHPSLSPTLEVCQGGGNLFADSIFLMVDSVVNFADYDQDQDGIVDGFFFIILASGERGCACLGDYTYKTHDTTVSGDTIQVLGERGVEIGWDHVDPPPRAELIHHCVHQWGHQLGLPDLYRRSGYG